MPTTSMSLVQVLSTDAATLELRRAIRHALREPLVAALVDQYGVSATRLLAVVDELDGEHLALAAEHARHVNRALARGPDAAGVTALVVQLFVSLIVGDSRHAG